MNRDNSNISAILDEVFIPIERNATITITYTAFPCAIDDEYVVDFRINAVNGFSSPTDFRQEIFDQGNAFLERLTQKLKTMPVRYRSEFGDKVNSRFAELLELVTFQNENLEYRPFTEEPSPGLFVFMQPNFEGDDYHDHSIYMDMIICAASHFAFLWWEVMAELHERIQILLTTITLLPEIHGHTNPPPSFEKIRMRLTVPQLACCFLFMVKNNLIDVNNKSDLFRSLADIFQTKGSDNLSWRNIKNMYDSPSPDDVEFWVREFQSLSQLATQSLKKFYN